jgi:hypothetical protein
MMTAEHIREWLREVPFQPFRIVTSSGESYEIFHPDTVLVTTRVLYIGLYRSNRPNVPDRVAHVAVMHVTELVPLDMPPASPPTELQPQNTGN